MSSPSYDVVIVGAGPVGQVLSLLLARAGRSVAVIERWPDPWPLPRACAIDHEGLRLLQGLGLADEIDPLLDKHGGPDKQMAFLDAEGEVLIQGWTGPTTDFDWPGHSSFFQPDLEALLLDRIAASALIDLRRGVTAVEVDQDAGSARVRIVPTESDGSPADSDGEWLDARWVIGADGANSLVRGTIGGDSSELDFHSDWVVVDFRATRPRTWDPHLGQRLDPRRPSTFTTAGPHVRRFEFLLLDDETPEQMNTVEAAWRLLRTWELGPEDGELVRHAHYRFGGRWQHRWRRGRLLLAGDAAHLMPPFLGQGMCSGFRDAAALAWRLDLVLAGTARAELLDSYVSERVPHVAQIIEDAVRIGELICVSDPEEARRRDESFRLGEVKDQAGGALAHDWRLGPGLADPADDLAGTLGIQGVVESDGVVGRVDDLVGPFRWQLVSTAGDPAAALAPRTAARFEQLGGVVLDLSGSGPVRDVRGDYARWFADRDIQVVLLRPDFYVHSASDSLVAADALVRSALDAVGFDPGGAAPDAARRHEPAAAQALADRLACEDVLRRYYRSIDTGRATAGAELVTTDARITARGNLVVGRRAVLEGLAGREAQVDRVTQHVTSALELLTQDDERMTMAGMLTIYLRGAEELPHKVARFEAQFAREDGAWRIDALLTDEAGAVTR